MGKRWWFRIVLVSCSLLTCLGFLEMTLRLTPPGRLDYRNDRADNFPRPAEVRRHPWVSSDTNAVWLAVIGDSFTEGSGIQQSDRYAFQLEWFLNLNAGTPPVAVEVFSHSGACTFDERRSLERALAIHPRAVVLGICLNDTENPHDPRTLHRLRTEIWPARPSAWCQPLLRTSRALGWIYAQAAEWKAQGNYLDYYRHIYDPGYGGRQHFDVALEYFHRRCTEEKMPLLAVIFPLFSHDLREGRYPFLTFHEVLHADLEDHGIHYLDLYPTFRNMDHERLEVIPRIDPHPNEIAHSLAAWSILKELVQENLVDASYFPRNFHLPGEAQERWKHIKERLENPMAPRNRHTG